MKQKIAFRYPAATSMTDWYILLKSRTTIYGQLQLRDFTHFDFEVSVSELANVSEECFHQTLQEKINAAPDNFASDNSDLPLLVLTLFKRRTELYSLAV